METYTNRRLIGQWMPQTLQDYDVSQTATPPVLSNLIFYQYKWHEVIFPPINPTRDLLDEVMLVQLYAEFAQEDRELANAGLADYAHSLAVEDLTNKKEIIKWQDLSQ